MSSGIEVNQDCIDAYNEIKTGKKHRYALFKISDNQKEIVLDCIGKREETYDDFLKAMDTVEGQARYAVMDYEPEANISKLVFIMWNPDNIKIKEKMMYSSSVRALKAKLTHTGTDMECNDKDELCVEIKLLAKNADRDEMARSTRFDLHSLQIYLESSGIQVKPECKERFEELKLRHKYSYIIYKIDDAMKNIEVDCLGAIGESYDMFCQKLYAAGDKKEGRFAVMDCQYDKCKSSKLVFIMWLPDNQLEIKQKMVYSSSKKALKDKLMGIGKEMQCNDTDDLAWSSLVEKCQSKYD